MTATATKAPPTKARKSPPRAAAETSETEFLHEAELRRYTAAEVVAKQLLPYKSEVVLLRKCYARQVIHHGDGNGITFTLDDIRRENARTVVEPIAA
ncbi:hypothetical protein [Streptomyces sp. NBC_00932]|uniref:hypothetical protein n=1 Tax=Streptomyces sp. NBC_00932 TaxID=2903690 RepID=UPI00386E26DB|nr:hypothetical protein OG221_27510 [Streptomyces sp. NBC_00932]